MWLDQDLLQVSQSQRQAAATTAAKATAPAPTGVGVMAAQAGRGTSGQQSFHLVAVGAPQSDAAAQSAGYAKGFAAGWAAGQKRAAREAAQEHARVAEEVRLAEEARNEAFADAMGQIANLALAMQNRDELVVDEMKEILAGAAIELAEALLGAELTNAETGAKAALRRALSVTDPKEIVKIHMNSRDLEVLQQSGVESPVTLIADPEMEAGDAIAYMPEGFLDARLSSAMDRARATLNAIREAGGELT